MRVLVATTAGAGHFGPMVPFALACAAAGHEVRVAAPVSFGTVVAQTGLEYVPLADPSEAELASVFAALPALSLEESNATVMREVFAGLDARAALPDMAAVVRDWRPDLILRETAEFSSFVVAEAQGIPHVQVAMGLTAIEEFAYPFIEDALRTLGSRSGTAGLRAAPTLSLVPEYLEDSESRTAAPVHRFRDRPDDAASDLGNWWTGIEAPLVYVTFGTVAASMGLFPDLYRAAIAAVADLPVRALVTLGEGGDPDILKPLPANVHVERYWPQHGILPHTSAMVGHGGFGTTMAGVGTRCGDGRHALVRARPALQRPGGGPSWRRNRAQGRPSGDGSAKHRARERPRRSNLRRRSTERRSRHSLAPRRGAQRCAVGKDRQPISQDSVTTAGP